MNFRYDEGFDLIESESDCSFHDEGSWGGGVEEGKRREKHKGGYSDGRVSV